VNKDSRRAHERKDSLNLLDYVALGEDGNPIGRGVGRTLNVSEEGLFIETHIPLSQQQTILLTVALEEDIVEIKGQVVHTDKSNENRFTSGIKFIELDEEGRLIVRKYVEALRAVGVKGIPKKL
jgi:Tfp pilus assembly protein PilZ